MLSTTFIVLCGIAILVVYFVAIVVSHNFGIEAGYTKGYEAATRDSIRNQSRSYDDGFNAGYGAGKKDSSQPRDSRGRYLSKVA